MYKPCSYKVFLACNGYLRYHRLYTYNCLQGLGLRVLPRLNKLYMTTDYFNSNKNYYSYNIQRHLSLLHTTRVAWRCCVLEQMSTGEQKSELVSINQRLYYTRVLLCFLVRASICNMPGCSLHCNKFLDKHWALIVVSTTEQSVEGSVQSWRPSQDQATDRKRSRRPKPYIGQSAAEVFVYVAVLHDYMWHTIENSFCHQSGNTPLHYASSDASIEVVQFLLDHGANIHITNQVSSLVWQK